MYTKWFAPGEALNDARRVRTAVFVEEQEFSPETEFDDIDCVAHHMVLYNDTNEAVACGRIFADSDVPGRWLIGRVALMQELRRKGFGAQLMQDLEDRAKELGAHEAVVHAQTRVVHFYEKQGYATYGDEYMDEHVEHISMIKLL